MKGQIAKNCVNQVLLKVFSNAFVDGKDIRINLVEGGENIQLKVSCTMSKTPIEIGNNVESGGPIISETFSLTENDVLTAKELVKSLGIEV